MRDSDQSGARPRTCSSFVIVDKSNYVYLNTILIYWFFIYDYSILYMYPIVTCNALSRSHGSANFSGTLLCLGVTTVLKNFLWNLGFFRLSWHLSIGGVKWDSTNGIIHLHESDDSKCFKVLHKHHQIPQDIRQLLGTVFGKHHLREPWKADGSEEVSSGWVD